LQHVKRLVVDHQFCRKGSIAVAEIVGPEGKAPVTIFVLGGCAIRNGRTS
jgi:hypothetical protein